MYNSKIDFQTGQAPITLTSGIQSSHGASHLGPRAGFGVPRWLLLTSHPSLASFTPMIATTEVLTPDRTLV